MTACSVVSAIVERLQPSRNVRFFCRYRGNTGRSADIAKATQMTLNGSAPGKLAKNRR
jgi:hypothetical protein